MLDLEALLLLLGLRILEATGSNADPFINSDYMCINVNRSNRLEY